MLLDLRTTDAGRAGVEALLADPDPNVQLLAATHVLAWAPELGRPILERLRDSDSPCSFDAKWTLVEFDGGRLEL
jgi:hypothetical protein